MSVTASCPTCGNEHDFDDLHQAERTTGRWKREALNAAIRERGALRERVRSLPVNDEDGLWVRTQVLRLLDDEVTTDRAGAAEPQFPAPAQPAAAGSHGEGHTVEAGSS